MHALREARRVGTLAGATVVAAMTCRDPDRAARDLVPLLGRLGADRVALVHAPDSSAVSLIDPHCDALTTVCRALAPTLLLFGDTPASRDLAPKLAARLGSAWFPDAALESDGAGECFLTRLTHQGTSKRSLALDALDRPMVAVLRAMPAKRPRTALGDDVEVVLLAGTPQPPIAAGTYALLATALDPGASLEAASAIVTIGAGLPHELLPWAHALAHALGGELAATPAAVKLGLAPPDRVIGVGGRTVAPRLYVSCGASGSSGHLGAISAETTVVALDRNPNAPIFKRSTRGLVGELSELLPALVTALGAAPTANAAPAAGADE